MVILASPVPNFPSVSGSTVCLRAFVLPLHHGRREAVRAKAKLNFYFSRTNWGNYVGLRPGGMLMNPAESGIHWSIICSLCNAKFIDLRGRNQGAVRLSVCARAFEPRKRSLDIPKQTRWDKVKIHSGVKDKRRKLGTDSEVKERIDGTPRAKELEEFRDVDGAVGVDRLSGRDAADGLQQGNAYTKSEGGGTVDWFHRTSPLAEVQKKVVFVTDYSRKQAMVILDHLKNMQLTKYITTEIASAPPLPPFTGSLIAGLGLFLLIGIVIETIWWKLSRRSTKNVKLASDMYDGVIESLQSRTPSSLGLLLDRDLRRKESVEWVNMVIGKLWNLYRRGLEGWLVDLLQPIIDDIQKPDMVQRVEIRSFFLGDEPLTLRTVERRTSRRADDLQYHIGVRYTGGARMLLMITLKWYLLSISIPVGVRGLDVDAELWVKMRMVPEEPFIGQATWAFVTLPKIKLALAPFRLLNLMSIPFLSIFLAKLLTEDLPSLFVRPNKNVVDFLQGRTIGPVSKDFKGLWSDGTKTFTGELGITLMEARKLNYIPFLKTDPYVMFVLGEQVLRSKKNSQTSIIGPPGGPVWNQDFRMLVVDQNKQHLSLTVHDTISFTSFPVGSVDIDLATLQDTVPVDKKLTLKSGWGPFPKRFAGELLVRLTYRAYVDDDEEAGTGDAYNNGVLSGQAPGAVDQMVEVATFFKEEAAKVADFFQEKDLAKDMFESLGTIANEKQLEKALPVLGFKDENVRLADELPAERDGSGSYDNVMEVSAKGQVDVSNFNTEPVEASIKGQELKSPVHTPSENVRNVSSKEEVVRKTTPGKDVASSEPQSILGQIDSARKSSALVWLAVVTGLSLLVAFSFNLTNLFNP